MIELFFNWLNEIETIAHFIGASCGLIFNSLFSTPDDIRDWIVRLFISLFSALLISVLLTDYFNIDTVIKHIGFSSLICIVFWFAYSILVHIKNNGINIKEIGFGKVKIIIGDK